MHRCFVLLFLHGACPCCGTLDLLRGCEIFVLFVVALFGKTDVFGFGLNFTFVKFAHDCPLMCCVSRAQCRAGGNAIRWLILPLSAPVNVREG